MTATATHITRNCEHCDTRWRATPERAGGHTDFARWHSRATATAEIDDRQSDHMRQAHPQLQRKVLAYYFCFVADRNSRSGSVFVATTC